MADKKAATKAEQDPQAAQREAEKKERELARANREKFGVDGKPIPATEVLVKDMKHNGGSKVNQTWIIVNSQTGTYTSANTYDGKTGPKYKVGAYSHPLGDEANQKALRKRWEKGGYKPVVLKTCPIVVKVEATSQAPAMASV